MPIASSTREFVDALKTGKTNICKILDGIFTHPGRHQQNADAAPILTWFSRASALDQPLPNSPSVRSYLRAQGMSNAEMAHINSWPRSHKRLVRAALSTAIRRDRNVQFFWELYSGANEDTDIHVPGGTTDIIITFRSPRSKVRMLAADRVRVDI